MKNIEFGIYTLGDYVKDPVSNKIVSEQERIEEIINAAKLAEKHGFDFFGVGESHQEHFVSQAHALILAAIARETKKIKITSSATIVSTSDPVRVYENFTTLDLLSNGRAEIIAGRASRIGLFNLLGYSLRNYEELYEEKFELLLKLFKEDEITWDGKFRASLKEQKLYPKPIQKDFPIWRAVGGHKSSAYLAAKQGVNMSLASIMGSLNYFGDTINVYREIFKEHHPNKNSMISLNAPLYLGLSDEDAFKTYYKYLNNAFLKSNGNGISKQAYLSVLDIRNVALIGGKETLIKKLVHQFKTFKHDRHFFQIDLGGMPFKEVKRMIKTLGNEVIPEVKRRLEEI